jgi:hypothetical protein
MFWFYHSPLVPLDDYIFSVFPYDHLTTIFYSLSSASFITSIFSLLLVHLNTAFKHLVHTSKKTQPMTITKTNQLMPFKQIMFTHRMIKKTMNTLRAK